MKTAEKRHFRHREFAAGTTTEYLIQWHLGCAHALRRSVVITRRMFPACFRTFSDLRSNRREAEIHYQVAWDLIRITSSKLTLRGGSRYIYAHLEVAA